MPYRASAELDSLMEKLLGKEKNDFYNCIANPLPHTIRFNSLKGEILHLKEFLEEQKFRLEYFPGFVDVFRLLYQPYPIGKSLSHFLGHFYVQDIASMLPPRVLDPQPGETVLDLSAAPGSKTTQMAVMMKNQGIILANDIVFKRLRALINNLLRMGIIQTAVTKSFGESIGNMYFETFDKILLDPACSGLGTLHKTPEVLSWWTHNHCIRLAASQRSLISSAIKALKPGGILVYSTCTLTPEENEEVIHFAKDKLPVEILPVDLPQLKTRPALRKFEGKIFHSEIENCRRLYSFENETEGFFIAKLRKTASLPDTPVRKDGFNYQLPTISHKTSPVKKYLDYFSAHFDIPRSEFSRYEYQISKDITVFSREVAQFNFRSKPIKCGLTIGRAMTQIGKLTTEGIHFFGNLLQKNRVELENLSQLEDFVNRRSLEVQCEGKNQLAFSYRAIPIGYGLEEQGKIKSQFPKAEWPFILH